MSTLVGATNVSASFGPTAGSAVLTVISPVPVALVISPANPTIFVSGQEQFSATLNYSDGSFLNVTTSVTWNSSNPVAGLSVLPDWRWESRVARPQSQRSGELVDRHDCSYSHSANGFDYAIYSLRSVRCNAAV